MKTISDLANETGLSEPQLRLLIRNEVIPTRAFVDLNAGTGKKPRYVITNLKAAITAITSRPLPTRGNPTFSTDQNPSKNKKINKNNSQPVDSKG